MRRDPIGDAGGVNLLGFVNNNAQDYVDLLGEAIWWDCCACAAALVGKFGGTVAGCAYGCAEVKSPSYPWGECLSDCVESSFTPEELLKQFKGNPAEWIGAAACVSCGVRAVIKIVKPCSTAQRRGLQNAVEVACKGSGKMGCKPGQSLFTLRQNRNKFIACIAARTAINVKCFHGGDAGHRKNIADAAKGLARCEALIRVKGGSL